jgi:hypothetical protein
MPKRILPLSDLQIRTAKPREKDYKISDGYGLYLLITPSGGKLWRIQYRYDDKQKLLSLGSYPQISLADARHQRDEARNLLANGIDPNMAKRAQKASRADSTNSFEVIAREWHTKFKETWSQSHAQVTITRLERDVFPWIGNRPISEIEPPEVLKVLQRIESRGAGETARRMKIVCG